MQEPRQRTLRRLAEHGLRPNRELGQHFLLDDNLLLVIDRLAALRPDDTVLEVGAGVGTLTEHLALQVARVDAIEIDRRLEPALDEVLAEHANVHLHWGDAMRLDLGALDPPPTAFVANLPYNVAAPLILRSIDALPTLRTWCCLVQKEAADRFLARASEPAYGAPSVLCGLAFEPAGRHAVSRSVFIPVPNVDSSLVAFRRRADWAELAARWPAILAVVSAAFAHRRKTLANSLALAGWAGRSEVERICAAAGVDPRIRAEALAPDAFVSLVAAAAT
ncbi:MAG: 16S rRNA (adenine(1518)-N(6)/adenine(1519)-N(6))-dimethyltransferase RsmA [Gaiellales bacterium]